MIGKDILLIEECRREDTNSNGSNKSKKPTGTTTPGNEYPTGNAHQINGCKRNKNNEADEYDEGVHKI